MNELTDPLVELIYCSRSINSLTQDDFEFLLDGAQQKNRAMDITGAILYSNGYFLQLIEGKRRNINRLFQSISHDARHFEISLMSFRVIETRHFPDWAMNYCDFDLKPFIDDELGLTLIDADACRKVFTDLYG